MNTTARPIRRAPQNPSFRLPDREDLVAGAELYMIEPDASDYGLAYPYQRIRLDKDPIRVRNDEEIVYYHCTYPSWEGQCFVPLSAFLDCNGRPDPSGWDNPHYWLKIGA